MLQQPLAVADEGHERSSMDTIIFACRLTRLIFGQLRLRAIRSSHEIFGIRAKRQFMWNINFYVKIKLYDDNYNCRFAFGVGYFRA